MKKKTVLINTDYPLLKTGLGRNGKEIALYLHKTGKYNIIYYCCGMQWENPDYQRLPFKCAGSLPNNPMEMEQLNKDQGYARACAYGLYNIERAVKEFKPDVCIFSNDSWGVDFNIGKPFWNKIHCIPHITLDSLPFLDQQIDLIKKSKHMFVWAEFAEKECKRLGYNHVKTLGGIIRPDNFYKLIKPEKIELRKKFNIPLDAFITGFVFRNQLRKEVRPLMEGYALFKKENPEIKNTFLLFHTHWSEPQGWNFHKFCDEFHIPKEELLTTYVCRACREIEVKPFTGQDVNCRFCGAQKSQVTCNVVEGATEQQLNQVYNLMDCYCHNANAMGLEIPIVEALYTELPTATNAYASGTTFTDQDFVTTIDHAWTVQLGTQFKRAAAYPSSVSKFLKKVAKMPVEKRTEIGKKGREWAISKFSPEVICKQWEEYIDSLPEINWDYNFTPEPKNDKYPMPDIKDDSEWVINLYKEILKMSVDTQDSGYINWMENLKRGAKREDIYNFFINVARDENAKNVPQVDYKTQLIDNGKKQLLIVLKESIGDLILSTALLKSFRINYPKEEWNIYFATLPQYKEIFDGNENIDKVLDYQPFMESELASTGQWTSKGYFDAYAHLGNSQQHKLNYLTNYKICLPNESNIREPFIPFIVK